MISNKELNELLKECKNTNDYMELITNAINENILVTNNQLLKIVKIKNEKANS